MGMAVDISFSTEKLSSFSILCFLHVSDILALKILVRIFLVVSISVIGLMFVRFPFQLPFLGIRMMMACFHYAGTSAITRHLLSSFLRLFYRLSGLLIQNSFGILN